MQPLERPKSGAIRWSQTTPRARERFFAQAQAFAARAHGSGSPGEINLSRLDMDSRLFPLDEFRRSLQRVFARQGASLLNYGEAQGYLPLRPAVGQF